MTGDEMIDNTADRDRTELIPAVPPTPPAGVTWTDVTVGGFPPIDTHAMKGGGLVMVPAEALTERHERALDAEAATARRARKQRRGVHWGLALITFAVAGIVGLSLTVAIDDYFDRQIARQKEFAVNYQLDWLLARMDDEAVWAVCKNMEREEWRGGAIDDFVLAMTANWPDAPLADRESVEAYVVQVCTADVWESRRKP